MVEYIDREAFVAKGRERYCANCDLRKGMKNGKLKFVYRIGDAPCRACRVDDMITEAEDFPAADVRPVVRGEWKEWWPGDCALIMTGEEMLWACSECWYKYSEKQNFCPNCGADMRKEED